MSQEKRTGKYRHIYGDPYRPEKQFLEIKNPLTSGEGTYVKANTKFWAVGKAGGGGPVYVHPHDRPGRLPANVPMISVHKGKCWDFDFHPFVQNMLATGSEDCRAMVTSFPMEGLTETITEPQVVLEGHQKKVTLVKFHPSAMNILGTAAFDRTVKVWNIETAECVSTLEDFKDTVYSIAWAKNGETMAATSKDKHLRVFDPRNLETAMQTESFDGGKSSKCFYVPRNGWIGACGFSKTAKRQLKLWDVRKLADPIYKENIDQAASVLCPEFDDDNGVLYLVGKGEGAVTYSELFNDDRMVYQLGAFRQTEPQKGGGWVPKPALDVWKCEVMRFLKLTNKSLIPVSFIVPRKAGADVFQEDIFPDCSSLVPALGADEYLAGENKAPNTMVLDPARRTDESGAVGFTKKKTYAELAAENERLRALVTQLGGNPDPEETDEKADDA